MTVYNTAIVSTKNYVDTQNAFLPSVAHVALEQENGIEFLPCVKIGDVVQEGQVIATASSSFPLNAVLHSSVPGVVKEIVPSYFPNGRQGLCVNIKTKGSFSYLGHKISEKDLSYISPSSISSILAEKGVINTFRVDNPLNLALQIYNKKCHCLVVRLFDDERDRLTDSLITKFYLEQVIKGSDAIAKALEASCVVFAVEASFDIKKAEEKYQSHNYNFIKINSRKYPFGDKTQIIATFNKEAAKKRILEKLSFDDLFIDSSTAYDVYKAVFCSVPVISKMVTFTGNCLNSSCMLDVRIGTPISDVIKQIGGLVKRPSRVIVNGSFLGNALQSLDSPITKYTKFVRLNSTASITDSQIYSCINCGNCRSACPQKLLPDLLFANAQNYEQMPEFLSKTALLCTACGVCNCACPSRLPLNQTIEVLKNILQNKEAKNEKQ